MLPYANRTKEDLEKEFQEIRGNKISMIFQDPLSTHADLLPGALHLLQAVHGKMKIALVSNGVSAIQRSRLAKCPLTPLFDVIVISEEVGAAKPDPTILHVAMEKLGCRDKSQAVMMGDSLSADIPAAINAGVDSIFFSLNDIAYWSLMPAISKDQKVREGVGAFARICANVGMFSMVLIYLNVPSMFSFLNMSDRDVYFVFAIICALIMWAFQSITLFGVKEDRSKLEKEERTSLKDLWRALVGNDQLMVTAVSMALFMIGYCTTTAFGTYYFKYAVGDEGLYMVFAAVLAVATAKFKPFLYASFNILADSSESSAFFPRSVPSRSKAITS